MYSHLCLLVAFLSAAACAVEAPTVQQLQENPQLLQQLYEPAKSPIVQEYYFRGYLAPGTPQPDSVPPEYYNQDLYVVRDGSQVLYIKKMAFRHPDLSVENVTAGESVLCLANPSGGNGWNANPWFVVARNPLALLGQVSGPGDPDQDEQNDLVVIEDVWESGWPQLDHVEAPAAIVFMRVDQHRLIPDDERNSRWAQTKVRTINETIKQVQPGAAAAFAAGKPAPPTLFSGILLKLLYYRIWGQNELGWEEFKKDLRLFDEKLFPVARFVPGKGEVPTTPIEDIEKYAAETFEQRGDFKTWLTNYVSTPLTRH